MSEKKVFNYKCLTEHTQFQLINNEVQNKKTDKKGKTNRQTKKSENKIIINVPLNTPHSSK